MLIKNILRPRVRSKNKNLILLYRNFIDAGDICFDVGANNGERTELFLKLKAKVISIEPQKKCMENLKKKYKNKSNVILVHKGLSDKVGTAFISVCENAPTISTMSKKWKTEGRFSKDFEWKKEEKIQITTLDKMIERYGIPAFCKIDVEGYEFNVIKGLSRPIPAISFEFTKEFIEDSNKCTEKLLSLGMSKFNVSIGESGKMLFKKWVGPQQIYDKLKKIKDPELWGDIYAKY